MRDVITSKEISKLFGKAHRDVTRSIRTCIDSISYEEITNAMFKASTHTVRGNTYSGYDMNIDGFMLLTDTRAFSRGSNAKVKAEILADFGVNCVVLSSLRTRFEDDFYTLLKLFLHKHKIMREVPVAGYRVDFYICDEDIIVEYDEEPHLSATAKKADSERDLKIKQSLPQGVHIIRIPKGSEIEGLSVIAGLLAVKSNNAESITRYFE